MILSHSVVNCANVTASHAPDVNFQVALSNPVSKRIGCDEDGNILQVTRDRTAISIADTAACARKNTVGLDPKPNSAMRVRAPRNAVAVTIMELDNTWRCKP